MTEIKVCGIKEEDDLLIDDNFDINKKKMNKIIDKNFNEKAYPNNIEDLSSEYNRKKKDYLFKLKVNDNNKNMPIFNLRSSDKIDFYWNFHLHNTDNTKINNFETVNTSSPSFLKIMKSLGVKFEKKD